MSKHIKWVCPLCNNIEEGHGHSFIENKLVICSKCKRGIMEFDNDTPRDYYDWIKDLELEDVEMDW